MIMIHNHLEVVTPGTVYILLYPDAIHLHADVVVVLDHLQIVRFLVLFILIPVVMVVDRPHRVA